MTALRDDLEAGLLAATPEAVVFGREDRVDRLPNTTLFALPGIKAETAVIAFDLEGVAVSSGAACSSGKVQPSHVLAAMGVPGPLQGGAVRASLGWNSGKADIETFLSAWTKLASALSKGQRGIAA
jgi:cysteine desulfurase